MKPINYLFILGLVTFMISCAGSVLSEEFAQEAVIAEKKVQTRDGRTICLVADPKTQCERAVDCDTGKEMPYVSVQEAFRIGDGERSNPVKFIATPGLPCQTFIADDGVPGNTRYYCSGGKCYPY